MGLYEQVILTDIEFSDSQNVDQALWKNVFYQVIERFRQLLKDPTYDNTPHIRNMLLTLLDEVRNVWEIRTGQAFYKMRRFVQGRQIGGVSNNVCKIGQDKGLLTVFVGYTVVTLLSIWLSTGISKPQISMIIYY